ncbi:MAG: hypothetical protein EOO38_19115 [Cytophagaceae bacterium]|nr:MAG: hypothetical protein EOO38_19115 [Cytophagaceae bacterium]
MTKRRKFTWPELVLLLIPTFALVGWGVWLQARGPSKPSKLVISEIKVKPLGRRIISPPDPNTRGIQVTVFIGHEGPAPSW